MSLRVTLSMAEMWSASTAWRRPNVYASNAVPKRIGCFAKATNASAQAATLKATKSAKIAYTLPAMPRAANRPRIASSVIAASRRAVCGPRRHKTGESPGRCRRLLEPAPRFARVPGMPRNDAGMILEFRVLRSQSRRPHRIDARRAPSAHRSPAPTPSYRRHRFHRRAAPGPTAPPQGPLRNARDAPRSTWLRADR